MKFYAFCFLLVAASAPGAVFTVNPLEDTFVSSAHPQSSYGLAGQLSVAADALAKGEFDSLMKFDLAPAVANFNGVFGLGLWSIQSMTLTFTNSAPNNALFNGNASGPGGTNVNLSGQFTLRWMQNDGWVQGTGSPNAPGTAGITFTALPSLMMSAG